MPQEASVPMAKRRAGEGQPGAEGTSLATVPLPGPVHARPAPACVPFRNGRGDIEQGTTTSSQARAAALMAAADAAGQQGANITGLHWPLLPIVSLTASSLQCCFCMASCASRPVHALTSTPGCRPLVNNASQSLAMRRPQHMASSCMLSSRQHPAPGSTMPLQHRVGKVGRRGIALGTGTRAARLVPAGHRRAPGRRGEPGTCPLRSGAASPSYSGAPIIGVKRAMLAEP